MKFGLVTQFYPLDRSYIKKFEISKIQDDGGRHLEKSTYLRQGLSDFDKIWHSDAVRPS